MMHDKLKRWSFGALILAGLVTSVGVQAGSDEKANTKTVSAGMAVSLEYTLKLEDDSVIDTNVGGDSLTYTQGAHQIVPGLEKKLEGMKVGESKHVVVSPNEGYGEVIQEAFIEVPKDKISSKGLLVGAVLEGKDAEGRTLRPRVAEIKEKTVVLDHNHPLAGKTLYFDVKVLDIHKAKAFHP